MVLPMTVSVPPYGIVHDTVDGTAQLLDEELVALAQVPPLSWQRG